MQIPISPQLEDSCVMTLVESYPLIKQAHIALVLSSVSLFSVRWLLAFANSKHALRTPMRHLSYFVDTSLLLAALLLLEILQLNPFSTPWLTSKLFLLLTYIALGIIALKQSSSRSIKIFSFAAALLCFAVMISIAHTHDYLGFLALLKP